MLVTIRGRKTENARWDGGHGCGPILRTVEIADRCPQCGGLRGLPIPRPYCDDGEWYSVDNWNNPCGHVDAYAACLTEAQALADQRLSATI